VTLRPRGALRALVPQVIRNFARRLRPGASQQDIRYVGNYSSWSEAAAAARGYADPSILANSIEASRLVKTHQAAFERDGIAFASMEYHFPLAWALARVAAWRGRLNVLDIGGALGSTYHQNRHLLPKHLQISWSIVEQPAYVEAGRREFSNDEVTFHASAQEALGARTYDLLLLSGVLQYVAEPDNLLDSLLGHDFPAIILDRIPLIESPARRLTVQSLPLSLYRASYPAWFFSEIELLSRFDREYDLVASWSGFDRFKPDGARAEAKGFLFEKIATSAARKDS
jgi:putative methyltransferase (TIGR04325 family)